MSRKIKEILRIEGIYARRGCLFAIFRFRIQWNDYLTMKSLIMILPSASENFQYGSAMDLNGIMTLLVDECVMWRPLEKWKETSTAT